MSKTITFLLLNLFLFSCKKDEETNIYYKTLNVKTNSQDTLVYNTELTESISTISITDSTKYHELSELFTGSDFITIFHRYKAAQDYTGYDTLKLKYQSYDDVHDETIGILYTTVIIEVK